MRFIAPITAALVTASAVAADPIISEFMARNTATITDEDGDFSDWVEVHNPDPIPVALDQWCLTDSETELTKWRFPDVTLAPGEFLLVWASGKNRRVPGQALHANYSLDKDGEYLALVRADGTTVVSEFAPQFAAQEDDESFGSQFVRQTLIAPGAIWRYAVPDSESMPGSAWMETAFDDSAWASGASGLGYGLTAPGITVRQVFKNGAITGLADAVALLALPPGDPAILSESTEVVPVVNYLGDGPDGHYGNNALYPGGGDNFAIRATGFLEIPVTGTYTFGKNTDDGGRIVIDGVTIVNDDSGHAPQDHLGTRFLAAGTHSFEFIQYEQGGGDCAEFFAAAGSHAAWSSSFRLVGDTAGAGLAASTAEEGAGGLVSTNLSGPLTDKPGAFFRSFFDRPADPGMHALSLVMRHNDGFAAWVNGVPAAADHAPDPPLWDSLATTSRTTAEALRGQGHSLGGLLSSLQESGNVLAVQGMKAALERDTFLVLPELIAGKVNTVAERGFFASGTATPGWINGAVSSLGALADTSFSVDRGHFTAPFLLELACATPGATIRYTTDGSTPTETHGTIYTTALNISATTVLRAMAHKAGWVSTNVDTQTYLFPDDIVNQSFSSMLTSGWPGSSGTSQVIDYGMDPEIVNSGNAEVGGPQVVKDALQALPAVSITTDLPNLFNMAGSQGIYSNPGGRGLAWERPASMEWINPPDAMNPNGTGEFQVDAGLRIRGGFSRSGDNPKHAFRFICRDEYGDKRIEYPLFGRDGAREFDKIDLRTAQNYSWSFGGDGRNTFLREEASRVAQLDMGQPGSRVRYVHLYLNGKYWGLYNLDERTEAFHAATYLGGDDDDYDVVKADGTADFRTVANDGNLDAWRDLWDLGKAHRSVPNNTNYFNLLGLAADGTTPTGDPVLLDVDNLIDYLLVTFWTGNLDGATSAFLGNTRANNWSGSRRRDGNTGRGFNFYVHDFEHTFLNVNENRTGPYISANESNFSYANPLFIHQDLTANAEYRMRWADRVQRHFFDGGALHPAEWNKRITELALVVDKAIAAESARWGDAKRSVPYTRLDWESARDEVLGILEQRAEVVLAQLRADNLYPNIDAPGLLPVGPYVSAGTEVLISGPSGADLYHMPDGSDPRLVGGALKPGAVSYQSDASITTLLPASVSAWRYLYDGSDQGTAWREFDFSTSGWSNGTAELGYGDGDEATVIPVEDADPVAPGFQAPATVYFRRNMNIADVSGINDLSLTVKYDDSYAAYLNGVRVAGNLPVDAPYDLYFGSVVENATQTTSIDPSVLQVGGNVLAIEIHQASPTSSDISMDASLVATRVSSTTPLILSGSGEQTVRLRTRLGATWSAMSERLFLVDTEPASPSNLAISEVMYHPADPSAAEIALGFEDAEDFEFLELLNTGPLHVDLEGVYLFGGVEFDCTGAATGRTLAPGERILVVSNLAAFEARYGSGLAVAGEYSGQLSNGGEWIGLATPEDVLLRGLAYSDDGGWPPSADGAGNSLVRRHPNDPLGDNTAEDWRSSGAVGGSPGAEDAPAAGTFDAWAGNAFDAAGQADPAVSGFLADPDGDGRNNFGEFALATNPLVVDVEGVGFVWSTEGENSYPALEFRRPAGVTGVLYELLATADPEAAWSVVAAVPAEIDPEGDGRERVIFRDEGMPAETGYLRLQFTALP